jgi:phosphoribosylformylglycinamidine synthase
MVFRPGHPRIKESEPMLHRLAVGLRSDVDDVQGRGVARRIKSELGLEVDRVGLVRIFTVDGLDRDSMREAVDRSILHDPVLHNVSLSPLGGDFDWIMEIGFKPGVTDNEGRVAQESLKRGLGLQEEQTPGVYTATQYLLSGALQKQDVERIASDLLANQLIEQYRIKSREQWRAEPGFAPEAPRVTGLSSDAVETVPLSGLHDEALLELSRDRVLALTLKELRCIRDYYARADVRKERQRCGLPEEPTDAELEVLAQTWSEHCKHKIFNARIDYEDREKGGRTRIDSLFKTYIQASTESVRAALGEEDFCLSVFKDNAGVIRFDDDYNVCVKVETHNSPSALDPYGGALTGIVGVNRDPMGTGLGANLVCNTDVFCFADPMYREQLPPRLLHPHRVMEGVRRGVEHGGNQSGIPTVNGSVVFDNRFLGKPLVFCGTVGLMPAQVAGRPSHEKRARPGDAVVMVGGRVGKDGIHGATFSSEALHAGSPATAVQIGDPITQRKMYDFLMRARDLGLYSAITDNGAGGLSSSVGETAEDSGGCDFDLARVPLKYDGLVPWEILLSEAQERMTLAVPRENLDRFLAMAGEMDVMAVDLGDFTNSGYFRVRYAGRMVAQLGMEFLHHGLPQMELEAVWQRPEKGGCQVPEQASGDRRGFLRRMLGRLNICSREYIIRQYDHEVQGGSVIKPLVGARQDGPGDAAVLRPVLDRERGLVVSNGICPRYSDLDTYWMMACAIDEAVRNNVAAGGDLRRMAGVDNFCWCDPVLSEQTPDGRYKLAQLVRANRALAHFCRGFGVPCISGKDSMKNDYFMQGYKISIPPTVLFSVVSVAPSVKRTVSSDLKRAGDRLYLLGPTRRELGGSEFASETGQQGGSVPHVDLLGARRRYSALHLGIVQGLINACHDVSDGGLAVAVAEMAIGGDIGVDVDLDRAPGAGQGLSADEILYSETPSRLLASVPEEKAREFEELFAGQQAGLLGRVRSDREVVFSTSGGELFRDGVEELRRAWKETLDW